MLKLNDEMAHYAIQSDYSSLVAQRAAKQNADAQQRTLSVEFDNLELQKRELDAQRKNFRIAETEINRSLAYIFFSENRIKIELGDDQLYHLKSNGITVDPRKVSCGERNAIALCYFFAEIAKDMDVKAIYSDEVFLAIDDPVSSFDLENRIGILSFLRWKLGQILLGCQTTKVLVMTHDISVLYDLEKVFQEISKEGTNAGKSTEFKSYEIRSGNLVAFNENGRKHNEYTRLLETVFGYAQNGTNETELFIGNMMRRVLEAFATFIYRKGVVDISCDESILEIIPENKREYFHNLMYRLVLHGESHYEEHIQGLQNMDFFAHVTTSERHRTAKDILSFLYLLNKAHITAHLPDAITEIEEWVEAIGSQPAVVS